MPFKLKMMLLPKKDGPKIYRLFKLFCLKDRVFNSLISREKKVVMPISTKKAADNTKPSAMVVKGHLKLPDYTDTEIMMDNVGRSLVEL